MYPINNDYINDNPEFDDSLHEAMKNAGFVFPENENDLDHLIAKFSQTKTIIPGELNDPLLILKRGLLSVNSDFNTSTDDTIDANLAQAAREGGTIEIEVKNQMIKDRKSAEDERGNQQDK